MPITVVPVDPSAPTNAELFAALVEVSEDVDTIKEVVDDLKTEALGSWRWDKVSGILSMVDTTGVDAFKFAVADSAAEATRERRQDLEAQ